MSDTVTYEEALENVLKHDIDAFYGFTGKDSALMTLSRIFNLDKKKVQDDLLKMSNRICSERKAVLEAKEKMYALAIEYLARDKKSSVNRLKNKQEESEELGYWHGAYTMIELLLGKNYNNVAQDVLNAKV